MVNSCDYFNLLPLKASTELKFLKVFFTSISSLATKQKV